MSYNNYTIMIACARKRNGRVPGLIPTARRASDFLLVEKIRNEFLRRHNKRIKQLKTKRNHTPGYSRLLALVKYAETNLAEINKIIDRKIRSGGFSQQEKREYGMMQIIHPANKTSLKVGLR